MPVRDSNGNELKEGDSVTLIKDLPVKGANLTLKRGTLIKNIHVDEDNEAEIEANTGKVIPFLVGMETNFRESIQAAFARSNGKPDFQIERGKTDACQRAIAEAINFLWMYGDPRWASTA